MVRLVRDTIFSAVIPTRNRPEDLEKAVQSVCRQTRQPDELIIVDQSESHDSRIRVESILIQHPKIKLFYVHNALIRGLVEAKNEAKKFSNGDIVCFLEDDVILEPDFIEHIELGFINNEAMVGCCGVVINPPNTNTLYKILFKLFHRGIFFDKRVDLYGLYTGGGNQLVPSDMISGGLSAWRKEVLENISFDTRNGFHMYEDIDFSTRVALHYGGFLFINPNARLAHYFSPLNRDVLGVRQRRKVTECFIYYKKRKKWPNATLSFTWLLIGMFLVAFFESASARSFEPIKGYVLGVRDGLVKKVLI